MSFNQPLRLMRGPDAFLAWPTPVKAGLLVLGVGIIWTLERLVYDFLRHPPDTAPGDEPSMFWIVVAIAATAVMLIPTVLIALLTLADLPVRLAQGLADRTITARLRKAAYGDDIGHGIVRVERFPWPGMHDGEENLPKTVQASVDRHILRHSKIIWPRLRAAVGNRSEFSVKDVARLVDESLTWDELAHTVYGRLPGFADLVIARLVSTGDWSARESGLSPEEVRAHWKASRRPASPQPPAPPLPALPKIRTGHLPRAPSGMRGITTGKF